jgi:hypothetical protein
VAEMNFCFPIHQAALYSAQESSVANDFVATQNCDYPAHQRQDETDDTQYRAIKDDSLRVDRPVLNPVPSFWPEISCRRDLKRDIGISVPFTDNPEVSIFGIVC